MQVALLGRGYLVLHKAESIHPRYAASKRIMGTVNEQSHRDASATLNSDPTKGAWLPSLSSKAVDSLHYDQPVTRISFQLQGKAGRPRMLVHRFT